MDKPLNIYQRLHLVMSEAPMIEKAAKGGVPYSHVKHDDVTDALRILFIKNGILALPTTDKVERDGNKTSVILTTKFINIDNPEDSVSVTFPGDGIDNQDKGIGKAVSYAFKYTLLKSFCLRTGDDVERDSIDHKPKQQQQNKVSASQVPKTHSESLDKKIGENEILHLNSILKASGMESEYIKRMADAFKVEKLEDLTIGQYNNMSSQIRIEQAARRAGGVK